MKIFLRTLFVVQVFNLSAAYGSYPLLYDNNSSHKANGVRIYGDSAKYDSYTQVLETTMGKKLEKTYV